MKKLIVIGALVGSSICAFAQGYINTSSLGTTFSVATNGPGGSAAMPSGTTVPFGFYFQLLVSSSSASVANPLVGTWTDTGLQLTNKNAGNVNSISSFAVNNGSWNAGVSNAFMLVGWSANYGSSWSAVLAQLQNGQTGQGLAPGGFYGVSAIGYGVAGAASPAPAFHIFGAPNASGVPINSLMTLNAIVVPEPGTIALACLGGASLLLFRRRK